MGGILTIIYFIAWLIIFLFFIKKEKKICAYAVIVLSYVVYASFSIPCYEQMRLELGNITLFPYIYLFITLLIALQPVRQYDVAKINTIKGIDYKFIYIIFGIFIVSSLIIIPDTVQHIHQGIVVMLASDDGAADLYSDLHNSDQTNAYSNGGILGYFKIIRYLLFEISVFLFSYYLTLKKINKTLIIFLLISFTIDILVSFSNGTRTGSTMSAFTLLISVLIFYRFYDIRIKHFIRKVGIIICCSFVLLMSLVTIGRSTMREGGALEGMIEYVGESSLLFNEYALTQEPRRNGDRTCNYFKNMLGYDNVPQSIIKIRDKYHLTLDDSRFSTFVGDFVIDFGPYITFIIFIFFSLIFCKLTRVKKGLIRLDQLLLVQLAADICMHGGMYLFYYSFSGNYIILMYIITTLIFRTIPGKITKFRIS